MSDAHNSGRKPDDDAQPEDAHGGGDFGDTNDATAMI